MLKMNKSRKNRRRLIRMQKKKKKKREIRNFQKKNNVRIAWNSEARFLSRRCDRTYTITLLLWKNKYM